MEKRARGGKKKKKVSAYGYEEDNRAQLSFLEYMTRKNQDKLEAEAIIKELEEGEQKLMEAEAIEVPMSNSSTWKIKNQG